MTNLYDDLVMDHIKNARNYRAMFSAQSQLSGFNPLCGDEITLFLNPEQKHIGQITFQATCCGIAMASTSIMTEMLAGQNREYVAALLKQFLALLGERRTLVRDAPDVRLQALLDTVDQFPSRVGCAALPWTTLESAMREGRINWPTSSC